jgi:UDP-3-O-[3-hydroxymyristoyl] N-acetylglucosamine deacetylase
MTNRLLRALFADDSAWEWEACTPAQAYRLPGAGVCRPAVAAR